MDILNDNFPSIGNWTKEQLKLAFYFYCQTPFGKLHSRNQEIIVLAKLIGRTPSAVAMKLVNFASLDPAITSTGRKGLRGASNLDKEIWNEFHADWEQLAHECEDLRLQQNKVNDVVEPLTQDVQSIDFTGLTRKTLTEQRVNQNFFRKSVLSSYRERCCISGISDARLLIASHIVPWSKDTANRLNPRNGLCLSAIHDKAFDRGLITLDDNLCVVVSKQLRSQKESFIQSVFHQIEGQKIETPTRFLPDLSFLAFHQSFIFLG